MDQSESPPFLDCATTLRYEYYAVSSRRQYNKDALRVLLRDHIAQSSQERKSSNQVLRSDWSWILTPIWQLVVLSLEKFYPEGWTPFFASPPLDIPFRISPRSVSKNDINDAKEVTAISPPLHMATAPVDQAATSPPRVDPRLDSANATVESEPTQYLDEFRFYHGAVPPRIWGEISYLLYRPSPEPELHLVPNPERAGRYGSGLHTSPQSVIRPRDHPLHPGRSQFTGNAEGLGYWSKRGERRLGDFPLRRDSPSVASDKESLSTTTVQSLFS